MVMRTEENGNKDNCVARHTSSEQDFDEYEMDKEKRMTEETKENVLDWLTRKLNLLEPGATPPNWKYIGLVFVALFSSSSTLTFLFPFIPEMVLWLGYSEADKGTTGGMIASCVFAGRIFGSVFWGWLADKQGRKIVLLITISLNGLFAGLFGLATNLPLAMFFRFMCGSVNGTVGTAKAILYDISDTSNQALSMTMLSLSWGTGLILGPLLGGVLAAPANKWPDVFSKDGLFGSFPYLLPSLFPFIVCCLVFVIIFFFFDETFVTASKKNKMDLVVAAPEEEADGAKVAVSPTDSLTANNPFLFPGHSQSSLQSISQSMPSGYLEAASSGYLAQVALSKKENLSTLRSRCNSQDSRQRTFSESDVPEKERGELVIEGLSSDMSKSVSHLPPCIVVLGESEDGTHSVCEKSMSRNGSLVGSSFAVQDRSVNDPKDTPAVASKSRTDQSQLKNGLEAEISKDVSDSTAESQHPLIQANAVDEEFSVEVGDDHKICHCCDWCCSSLFLCRPCRNSSLHRLLRCVDVWSTIFLYSLLSFVVIAVDDMFPVFASTRKDYGGLGFSSDEIGLAIGTMTLPLLCLQIKLYPFMVSKLGIIKALLYNTILSMLCCQLLPLVQLLNDSPVWQWTCLVLLQVPLKIAVNCCFAGTALLINNSVTQDLAGQVNGLAMMTTAIGRSFAPLMAGSFFTWTVKYGQAMGVPFDTNLPFFVFGMLFLVGVVQCLSLNPRLDKQKK